MLAQSGICSSDAHDHELLTDPLTPQRVWAVAVIVSALAAIGVTPMRLTAGTPIAASN
jgi:hypothetical protein